MNIQATHSALRGVQSMSADDPKLTSAAHEFEASLMQEILKPLQDDPLFAADKNDGLSGAGDESDGQGSSGALMSFGSEALAKAISERGGFGIATKILNHFRTVEKMPSAADTRKV